LDTDFRKIAALVPARRNYSGGEEKLKLLVELRLERR
jgi:hypothetical protein